VRPSAAAWLASHSLNVCLPRGAGPVGSSASPATARSAAAVTPPAGSCWSGRWGEHGLMPAPAAQPIRTERLDLVPLRVEHAAEMTGVLADPALYTFTGGAPPAAAELQARYQWWAGGSPDPAVSWCNWVIRLRAEQCLVGTVQATVSGPPRALVAEVAWVVGTSWQGCGIGTEAARGLVGWLRDLPVRSVIAHIHPGHHASAAVARAAGLTPTGHRRRGEVRWQLDI
jgi:RimJ/RimL family protein N-acetyltransferase